MSLKPSRKFCKHGYLDFGENYNQDLHQSGENIRKRCDQFYSERELQQMESEITQAECPICMEKIEDSSNCLVCGNGHKFHHFCLTGPGTNSRITSCPVCRDTKIRQCKNVDDVFSGGKKSRKTRKYKRPKKHSKKHRKSRSTKRHYKHH